MPKVMVVDDDPDVRDLCRVVLTHEGYQVLEAADAQSGISLAQQEQPDLVLLDWMMPDVDGMDALVALKHDTRTRRIPVVMLTALDGLPQINMASYNGADGYVPKPFEIEDLLSLIRRFMEE